MAIVWVTITIAVMVSLIGLAIDTGWAVLAGQQLQNAADAAALAGAATVGEDQTVARDNAEKVGSANKATGELLTVDGTDDVDIGYFHPTTRVFTVSSSLPNAVRASARRTTATYGAVPLFFGGVYGNATIDMTRDAIATINTSYSPALLVLDPTGESALEIGGSATVRVPNGAVQVNSSHFNNTTLRGSSTLDVQSLSIATSSLANRDRLTGTLNTNRAPNPDPLILLPEPIAGPRVQQNAVSVQPGNTRTIDPGYYPGGFDIKGTLIMNPGIYITDKPFSANAQANITGDGVMIFLRGTACLDFNSDGMSLLLNPPDPSVHNFVGADTYEGITVFQARANATTSKLPLSGTSQCNGTIYMPRAQLDITSSGGNGGVKLIVYRLNVNGTADLIISGLNETFITGTPYLVE